MAKNKTPEQRLVSRRHPYYNGLVDHWNFMEATYEGGRDWFEDNVFKYVKEGDTEFSDRQDRAYRFNHTREVVDLVNKYLFRGKADRNDGAPEYIQDFWSRTSLKGSDVSHYMAQVSKSASIFGRIYVVVDNNAFAEDGSRLTLAEAKRQKARVYAYTVKPQDTLDMSFDELGQLNWILFRETWRDDEDPYGDGTQVEEQFRLWTRTGWQLYRYKKGEVNVATTVSTPSIDSSVIQRKEASQEVFLYQSGTHDLGIVPVVIVDHMEDDNRWATPSLINDIAYLDRAVANYLSNLDAIIQDQTFSQLAMPAQALMPGEEEKIEKKLLELGTKRIFIYNGEGGAQPLFLSPDPRQAELIIVAIKQIINEIYHSVGVAGERTKQDNASGIDNSSGVAKAFDFERVNALLINKAKILERAEHQMLEMVALWNGKEDENVEKWVKYPDSFDVRTMIDEFEVASRLSLISAPKGVRQEQMKVLLSKLFPALSDKLIQKLHKEITEWPEDPPEFNATSGGVPRPNLPESSDERENDDEEESEESNGSRD